MDPGEGAQTLHVGMPEKGTGAAYMDVLIWQRIGNSWVEAQNVRVSPTGYVGGENLCQGRQVDGELELSRR